MAPFWDYFDDHFRRMRKEMEKMLEDMTKDFEQLENAAIHADPEHTKSWVFGMDAVIGPDGVPHIRTFKRGDWDALGPMMGSLPSNELVEDDGWQEPFTDVM